MTLKKEDIQLLKCLFDHGIFLAHHKKMVTIQRMCHDNVRKGLRKRLRRLESLGYVKSKGADHFSVTSEGRDYLSNLGEI